MGRRLETRGRSPRARRAPVCVNNGRSPSRKLFASAASKKRGDKGAWGGRGAEPPETSVPTAERFGGFPDQLFELRRERVRIRIAEFVGDGLDRQVGSLQQRARAI